MAPSKGAGLRRLIFVLCVCWLYDPALLHPPLSALQHLCEWPHELHVLCLFRGRRLHPVDAVGALLSDLRRFGEHDTIS